jgi:transposase, IS5 family
MIRFCHLALEGIMAVRPIGQEVLRFGARAGRPASLDELLAAIEFAPAGRALASLYPSTMGEKAWPPLAMFKALLLATWYDLSDVMLAEALEDRASFRRFCGFARDEATPERTAFVRFRRQLVEHGLDQSLFAAITRDLEQKGACVRKGTPIDATVIASVSKGDKEAAWVKHKSRAPAHRRQRHGHHACIPTCPIRKTRTPPTQVSIQLDFDSAIRRFESSRPSQLLSF